VKSLRSLPWSVALLLLAPWLIPVWKVILVHAPVVSPTVGRVMLVLIALATAVDLVRGRLRRPRLSPAAIVALLAAVALCAWIAISAAGPGCGCVDEVAGFYEVVAFVGLTALAVAGAPRYTLPLLISMVGGVVLTVLLAVAGVDGFTAATRDLRQGRGRLAGPLGNPNYLGYALVPALGVTLGLAAAPGGARRRVAAALLFAGLAVALAATFSRGAIIAVAVTVLVGLVLSRPSWRQRAGVAVGVAAAIAVAGFVLYPVFLHGRHEATGLTQPALDNVDQSGWDPRANGMIPGTTSVLLPLPDDDGFRVAARRGGGGVSRRLGTVQARAPVRVFVELRAPRRPVRVAISLQDNLFGNGTATRRYTIGRTWRRVGVLWRPTQVSPNARFYAWTRKGPAVFAMRRVDASQGRLHGRIPTYLRGTFASAVARGKDERDLDVRKAGVRLSLRAFTGAPLVGIGWGTFPSYAEKHGSVGPIPTHDEYLRFLAELGLVGAVLLLLVSLLTLRAAWTRRAGVGLILLVALTGCAVVLVFINGLVVSSAALPLAIVVGIVWGRELSADAAPHAGGDVLPRRRVVPLPGRSRGTEDLEPPLEGVAHGGDEER
jgi:O-antigen ligase